MERTGRIGTIPRRMGCGSDASAGKKQIPPLCYGTTTGVGYGSRGTRDVKKTGLTEEVRPAVLCQVHQPRVCMRWDSSIAAAAKPFMVPVTASEASATILGSL